VARQSFRFASSRRICAGAFRAAFAAFFSLPFDFVLRRPAASTFFAHNSLRISDCGCFWKLNRVPVSRLRCNAEKVGRAG